MGRRERVKSSCQSGEYHSHAIVVNEWCVHFLYRIKIRKMLFFSHSVFVSMTQGIFYTAPRSQIMQNITVLGGILYKFSTSVVLMSIDDDENRRILIKTSSPRSRSSSDVPRRISQRQFFWQEGFFFDSGGTLEPLLTLPWV